MPEQLNNTKRKSELKRREETDKGGKVIGNELFRENINWDVQHTA